MMIPDYSKYTLEELDDCLLQIDRDKYPERFKTILKEIEKRKKQTTLAENRKNIYTNDDILKRKVIITLNNGNTIEQILASRRQRLGAAILDGFLLIIPGFLIIFLLDIPISDLSRSTITTEQYTLMFILGQLLYLSMNGYLLYKNGQTIGKNIVGIRIVNLAGEIPDFIMIYLVRYLLFGLALQIPCMGWLVNLADELFIFRKDYRCLHDHLARTRVILV